MSTDMKKYVDYIHNMSGNILLGCDGFVDETYEIVQERANPTEFTAIENLKDFGELIVKRAGGGLGVEIVKASLRGWLRHQYRSYRGMPRLEASATRSVWRSHNRPCLRRIRRYLRIDLTRRPCADTRV